MPAPQRDQSPYIKGAYADREGEHESYAGFSHRWRKRWEANPELLTDRYCSCGVKLSRWNTLSICGPCETEARLDATG